MAYFEIFWWTYPLRKTAWNHAIGVLYCGNGEKGKKKGEIVCFKINSQVYWLRLCTLLCGLIVHRESICATLYVCLAVQRYSLIWRIEAVAEGQGWFGRGGYREKCLHTVFNYLGFCCSHLRGPPHSRPSTTLLCSPILFLFFTHLCPLDPPPADTLDSPPPRPPLLLILSMPFTIFFSA